MTIRLITGIPGSGKTLYAVSELKKAIEQNQTADEPRKIYCDITGLKLHDIPPPPIDWRDTPPKSLLIYDEAQLHKEFKPTRSQSPYTFVEQLTIHRKTGHEIWFITQDPKRLHNDILSVVEIHHHLERPYGAKLATIYHYRCHEKNPSAKTVKLKAENKTLFAYDKSLYELYESSQVKDGIKFRLPRELALWICVLIGVIGGTYYLWFGNQDTRDFVSKAKDGAKPEQTAPDEQTATLADAASKQLEIDGKTPLDNAPQVYTKEQVEQMIKLQQQKFDQQLEEQRLQLLMQYDNMQKQLIEHDQQIKDFYRTIELYKKLMPKDYKVLKDNPALQVRGVIKMRGKCQAYNNEGLLIMLSPDECDYYTQATGRVWKQGQTQDNITTEPRYPQTLTTEQTKTIVPQPQQPEVTQ